MRASLLLFLASFLLVYGGMNSYVYFKARSASLLSPLGRYFFIIFLALMTIAPLAVRVLERFALDNPARFCALAGYLWMAVVFLFFSASLVLDIIHYAPVLLGLIIRKKVVSWKPSPLLSFGGPLLLSFLVTCFGYFDAKNIRTETITIKTNKLPAGTDRLRIVQISDLHLGMIIRGDLLREVVAKVKGAEPDIIVSTGDLVDGQRNSIEGLSDLFQQVTARHGKYAVTGNHEFYAGLRQSLEFTKKAGFTVLRAEGISVHGLISLVGVDDPAGKAFGEYHNISEGELLSVLPRDSFAVLLKHRPLVDDASAGLFDLQLSGHTHKGQIFPFTLFTKYYYPHDSGLAVLPPHSFLYVSKGTGTWGPPVRVLAPPEITVIEIVRADKV